MQELLKDIQFEASITDKAIQHKIYKKDILRKDKRKEVLKLVLSKISKMPKEEPHLAPLRECRNAKRRRDAIKGVPHNVYFQIVGNGTTGGARSLFFYTDVNRYLFNCGEGTQRLTNLILKKHNLKI